MHLNLAPGSMFAAKDNPLGYDLGSVHRQPAQPVGPVVHRRGACRWAEDDFAARIHAPRKPNLLGQVADERAEVDGTTRRYARDGPGAGDGANGERRVVVPRQQVANDLLHGHVVITRRDGVAVSQQLVATRGLVFAYLLIVGRPGGDERAPEHRLAIDQKLHDAAGLEPRGE